MKFTYLIIGNSYISINLANKFKSLKIDYIKVNNPFDLQQSDPRQVRKLVSVVGERIVYELRGNSCLALENIVDKKSITVSRSFGNMINDK